MTDNLSYTEQVGNIIYFSYTVDKNCAWISIKLYKKHKNINQKVIPENSSS